MSRSKHSGGEWVEMPADESTKAGRTAKYDMRALRSKHGDKKVKAHSPWHQKNTETEKPKVTKTAKKAKAKAKPKGDRYSRKIDKMWKDL